MDQDDKIKDLRMERAQRAAPDPGLTRKDGFGRPLYCFSLSYDMDGAEWCTHVWAYDTEDAEKRVAAQRESLRLDGKLMRSESW